MPSGDWLREGRTWLHPECRFFVIEREVPELAAGGRTDLLEYHVVRGGGDDSAGFSVSMFSTVEEAIAEAERRHEEERSRR